MPLNTQPRLMLDTTNVIYEIADEAEPKMEFGKSTQKVDRRSELPMWSVNLYARGRAAGSRWSAVIPVTVLSTERPDGAEGEQIVPVDLEAMPYVSVKKDRDGKVTSTSQEVSFSCRGLALVNAPDNASALVGSAS